MTLGWHRPCPRRERRTVEPPDDPESWTDEQWIAWLERVDADTEAEPEGPPTKHGRSTGVQLLGAAMLGMHQAIYGDTETDIVLVVDASGDPPDPETLEIHIDPEDPDASTVTVRPWLQDETSLPDDVGD